MHVDIHQPKQTQARENKQGKDKWFQREAIKSGLNIITRNPQAFETNNLKTLISKLATSETNVVKNEATTALNAINGVK